MTRWWFQRFFSFTPILGEMMQFDYFFQMGCNHQLDEHGCFEWISSDGKVPKGTLPPIIKIEIGPLEDEILSPNWHHVHSFSTSKVFFLWKKTDLSMYYLKFPFNSGIWRKDYFIHPGRMVFWSCFLEVFLHFTDDPVYAPAVPPMTQVFQFSIWCLWVA